MIESLILDIFESNFGFSSDLFEGEIMDEIEAMESCIAMRYLKDDPVPRAELERLVYAATCASSPANNQG